MMPTHARHEKASNPPDFCIVGAPKCGTSSLAAWLSEHPSISMTVPKEPHYWNDDMANRSVTTWQSYVKCFSSLGPERMTGDASTWYLFSSRAIPRLECARADRRYIVCVRHPVDMVISLFAHNRRHLNEDQERLEDAWALIPKRRAGRAVPRLCQDHRFLLYDDACKLGSMLRTLCAQVSPHRVHIVQLEAMQRDPQLVYRHALDFLGLPFDGRQFFPHKNARSDVRYASLHRVIKWGSGLKQRLGVHRRFGISRLNEKKAAELLLSRTFADFLHQYFRDEALAVEACVSRQSLQRGLPL